MWATFMYLCRHVNVIRRPVNVCHGFVPSCFRYFCHSNVFHAHACHAIMCHAIVTSCKCLSCKRGHVNERPTSASSCVPSWLRYYLIVIIITIIIIIIIRTSSKSAAVRPIPPHQHYQHHNEKAGSPALSVWSGVCYN